ncbi:AAA family ATPase [Lederbergia citri]|uniref:AAA family ATPase n=1 Tax=Lederbergia citri TaxID=2833580 RepID=UPI002D7F8A73|nr:DnaB-like helicase C-terminal domain-containing protein [Lederbergia citri]
MPGVTDSYEYLAREIKDHSAKLLLAEYLPKLVEKFNEGERGEKLLDDLRKNYERITIGTSVREKVGTDIKLDGQSFIDEYLDRKAGKSFKLWRSKFPTINEQIGGYFSGNMYTWYGRSGRGKSVFTMEEIIEAAFQGANVLVWAMEMSRFEWMARAYSTISGRKGYVSAQINGIDYDAGFENRALLSGKLSEEFEAGLRVFVTMLEEGEIMAGNITLRAADDADFVTRDIRQLEADIIATKADIVLVDPIYLMDFENNTSRTAGGDVANTSKKIRRMAGTYKAVIHVVTQAEEVKDDTDDEGNRELRPPKRAEIKKTKAVLEDAANTFGIDSLDGEGIIEIGKGRNGGEGSQISVLYLPNYGIVREFPKGEEAVAGQFDF